MYQKVQLIQTKMNIPLTRHKLVGRWNLFHRLNEVVNYKLALIVAPAGFGKTTLISSWIRAEIKDLLPTVWISLDEDDNTPNSFWSYFLMAFSKIFPSIKEILQLGVGYQNFDILLVKSILSAFINECSKLNKDFIIIFDDFHVVENNSILDGMKFLIKNMPSNMHIVISSRFMPDLGLAKHWAANSILALNCEDLCFTLEESSEFFTDVMGMRLPVEEIEILHQRMEGWAAGMQLEAMRIRDLCKHSKEIKIANTNNLLIFDYMAEEVFFCQKDYIKKFLLFTSIFDEFCPELCDFVMGIKNSEKIIYEIDSLNLFLSELDCNGSWYCYHKLFRSFLRSRLDILEKSVVISLYDKAAEWYKLNNHVDKSICFYIQNQNIEEAVKSIEIISLELIRNGEAKLLHRWNSMLPKNVVYNNSRLMLNYAWASFAEGKIAEIRKNVKIAQGILKDYAHDEGKSKEITDEIAVLMAISDFENGNNNEMIKSSEYAIQRLKAEEFFAQLITLNIGNAYLLQGRLKEAVRCCESCLRRGIKTNNIYTVIISNKALMTTRKWYGQYSQAEKECTEVLSFLRLNNAEAFSPISLLYADISDIYYQRNELDKALAMAKKGLECGKAGENAWFESANYIMMAKIYAAMGLDSECNDTLEKGRRGMEEDKYFDTKIHLESIKALILISKGKLKPVSDWLKVVMEELKDRLLCIYPGIYLIQARLFLYKGQIYRCREVLNMLYKPAEQYNVSGLLVEVLILSAIVYDRLRDVNKADEEMERAVRLVCKEKMVRVFLNEGSASEKILHRLRKSFENSSDKGILEFYSRLMKNFTSAIEKSRKNAEDMLSKRELEILKLVQGGAGNAEIAEKLFVSLNTVKSHLLNIYTKLDVHSRTGAVAKAVELNLI